MKLMSRDSSLGLDRDVRRDQTSFFKVGPLIQIDGCCSNELTEFSAAEDGYFQTKSLLKKMLKELQKAGADAEDVTEVKIYTADMSKYSEYIKAFSEFFKKINPSFSLKETKRLKKKCRLLEIEMDAFVV